jgi:hypothetical protein
MATPGSSFQVKQADVAREAIERLGHESSSSAIRIAQRGSILNFPVSQRTS